MLDVDVYVYCVDLPIEVKGMVKECEGGYTIYINIRLTKEQQVSTFYHELRHIKEMDMQSDNSADEIEIMRHAI